MSAAEPRGALNTKVAVSNAWDKITEFAFVNTLESYKNTYF